MKADPFSNRFETHPPRENSAEIIFYPLAIFI
jgi:hypothetical protein